MKRPTLNYSFEDEIDPVTRHYIPTVCLHTACYAFNDVILYKFILLKEIWKIAVP